MTVAFALLSISTCRQRQPIRAFPSQPQEIRQAPGGVNPGRLPSYATLARLDSLISHCAHEDGGCLQVVEDSQFPLAGGRAYRDSLGLHLRLLDGTFRLLADDTSEGANFVHYAFHAYIEDLGYYLVHKAYYEGSADGLLSEGSGRLTTVSDLPVFSPHRTRFVVTKPYDHQFAPPSGIAVYHVDSTGITEEWSQPLSAWEASAPMWLSDTLIRLQRQGTDSLGVEPAGPITTMLLRFARGTWRLEGL